MKGDGAAKGQAPGLTGNLARGLSGSQAGKPAESESESAAPLRALDAGRLGKRLLGGERLWLFLDYDGTLADFAPTPDTLIPDPDLVNLLARLALYPEILRVVVMSGRRFSHIRALLPVPGILLAGTYGIEFQTWQGEQVRLLDFEKARPFLDRLKKTWEDLLDGQRGFYLEDKGYSLAIHARFADEDTAGAVLAQAARSAEKAVGERAGQGLEAQGAVFHILGGDRFLELAPLMANKGESVRMLLERFAWPGAGIIYIGDDDKDEEAFKVVRAIGGMAVRVTGQRPGSITQRSAAQYRLEDPRAVREWLRELAAALEQKSTAA